MEEHARYRGVAQRYGRMPSRIGARPPRLTLALQSRGSQDHHGAGVHRLGGTAAGASARASACEPYRELIAEALDRGRNAVAIWQERSQRRDDWREGLAAAFRRFGGVTQTVPAAEIQVAVPGA